VRTLAKATQGLVYRDFRQPCLWWALRIGLGAAAFLAGLDKFFNLLTNWTMYLSPLAERLLPLSGPVFMRAAGVIEMVVGLSMGWRP
jgi:uncharacterized membrane protein YphA (DoxX/SURF4 family)